MLNIGVKHEFFLGEFRDKETPGTPGGGALVLIAFSVLFVIIKISIYMISQ